MLAVRLMHLFSDCQDDFRPLTETLGLMFQIRDDYCNLVDADVSRWRRFKVTLGRLVFCSLGRFSFLASRTETIRATVRT